MYVCNKIVAIIKFVHNNEPIWTQRNLKNNDLNYNKEIKSYID